MGSTYANILLHIVFSTKNRRPLLKPPLRERVHEYLGGIVRGQKGDPLAVGGVSDHVHLLVRWNTHGSVSDLVRDLKGHSTKWLHAEDPAMHTFCWQSGYAVFSVSESRKAKVIAYIREQENHHENRDFKEEMLGLLRARNVAYDERYLWA